MLLSDDFYWAVDSTIPEGPGRLELFQDKTDVVCPEPDCFEFYDDLERQVADHIDRAVCLYLGALPGEIGHD